MTGRSSLRGEAVRLYSERAAKADSRSDDSGPLGLPLPPAPTAPTEEVHVGPRTHTGVPWNWARFRLVMPELTSPIILNL